MPSVGKNIDNQQPLLFLSHILIGNGQQLEHLQILYMSLQNNLHIQHVDRYIGYMNEYFIYSKNDNYKKRNVFKNFN